jgi:hypothetical protein
MDVIELSSTVFADDRFFNLASTDGITDFLACAAYFGPPA